MIGIATTSSRRTPRGAVRAPVAPTWSVNPTVASALVEGLPTATTDGTYDGTQPIGISYQWQTSADNSAWANVSGQTSSIHPAWKVADVGVYKTCLFTLSGPGGSATYRAAGQAVTASSPPGSGTATIIWSVPTLDGDGLPVSDLTGFRVYYSTTAGAEPPTGASSVDVANPAAVTTTLTGLESGRIYVWIASLDATGPGPAVLNSYHDIA